MPPPSPSPHPCTYQYRQTDPKSGKAFLFDIDNLIIINIGSNRFHPLGSPQS